jgi:hypothetical protein
VLHLVNRFFGFLTATPPSPRDQLFVSESLTPTLRRLFYAQRIEDQRHAITVASRVKDRPHLIEAALMHDIGKTTIGLGAFGRAFATLWDLTYLPIWGEWLRYINHGPIGADLLEEHNATASVVAFARYHPGGPPSGFDTNDWYALEDADHA